MVSDEASSIANNSLKQAIQNRFNIVLPQSGQNYKELLDNIRQAKKSGYIVHLRFVDTKPPIAAKRAIERYKTEGRFAEPMVHQFFGHKPKKNYNKLIENCSNILNSFAMYSNDVQTGKKN